MGATSDNWIKFGTVPFVEVPHPQICFIAMKTIKDRRYKKVFEGQYWKIKKVIFLPANYF